MDEAPELGAGRYRDLFGEKPKVDIFLRHLKRVSAICRDRDLKPMLWSDMFFRLSPKPHYPHWKVPAKVALAIPKDVDLVYWDYYHCETEAYESWFKRHRRLGFEPIMAGGLRMWATLWVNYPLALAVTDVCLRACKANGVRRAFLTLWGDDGHECDVFAALAGLQFFAEHGYADVVDPARLRAQFRSICGADYDDWIAASGLDAVPGIPHPEQSKANPSKCLLWQDPLLFWYDPQLEGRILDGHYERLARRLDQAARRSPGARLLALPAQVARVAALKGAFTRKLGQAYLRRNRTALAGLLKTDLPRLRRQLDRLWRLHRARWLATCKPFGWEAIELRYGFVRARLDTAALRLREYLGAKIPAIPELEEERHKVYPVELGGLSSLWFKRVCSPSASRT